MKGENRRDSNPRRKNLEKLREKGVCKKIPIRLMALILCDGIRKMSHHTQRNNDQMVLNKVNFRVKIDDFIPFAVPSILILSDNVKFCELSLHKTNAFFDF